MQAKIEIIDPAYAKQLLEQGITNRPISETAVLRYAKDMAEGKWESNGQGIVLTAAGMLLDGQHRMHAVIRANVPIGMLVVRGVEESAFVTLDSGRARQLRDVLAIDGFQNATQLAATARVAYNYIVGNGLRESPTKPTLHSFVAEHPYLNDLCRHVFGNSGKGPVRRLNTMLAAVLFLANSRKRYEPEAVEFQQGLADGQGLFKGDARLALREWIINHERGVGSVSQDTIFSAVAKGWNAYVKGQAMQIVRPIPNSNRDTLLIAGFERHMFPLVKDEPQKPRIVEPFGKNTAHLTSGERS